MSIFQVATLLVTLSYCGYAHTSVVNTTTLGLKASYSNQLALPETPQSPVFQSSLKPFFSLNLVSFFSDNFEVSEYCVELLAIFGQRYLAHANCLVSAARPVKVCQNCYGTYKELVNIYTNISSDQVPANVSCRDTLLHSDRLMLVLLLNQNLVDIWQVSECDLCLSKGLFGLTNDTLHFMATLNQTLVCFEKYQQQGNHSELCQECKDTYKGLNELYGLMERNHTLCIDIEDSVWSSQPPVVTTHCAS